MAKAVGIDIGSKSLKILELESIGNAFKITHFFNLEIPFGKNTATEASLLVEPIKRIFQEHHLERHTVAISLPTQDCILREIVVDYANEEHIKKIIKYEAEKYLHSYAIEDVIVDSYKLQAQGENKSKVFLTAVPKQFIRDRLELLGKCDLDPFSIEIDLMAIVNLAQSSPHLCDKKAVVIIDFGAISTKLAVMCEGKVRHVRAIRLGAHIKEPSPSSPRKDVSSEETPLHTEDIDEDISSELIISLPSPEGIDIDRVVLIKKDEEKVMLQQKQQEDLLQRLMREIKRTMLTLSLEVPIDLICVTGGGAQIPGILEQLQEYFQVKTTLLEFPQTIHLEPNLSEDVHIYAPVALGLTLGLMDKNWKGMNFRKEEFSYTSRFELFKVPLAVLCTLLFFLLAVWGNYWYGQKRTKEKLYDELLARVETVNNRIFENAPLEGNKFDRVYTLLEKLKEEQENRKGGGIPPLEDGFMRWRELFHGFDTVRKTNYITISRFSLTPKEGSMEGEMESDEILDRLKQVLMRVKDVDSSDTKTRVTLNENNPNPKDPKLKRRYKFQIGFQSGIVGE